MSRVRSLRARPLPGDAREMPTSRSERRPARRDAVDAEHEQRHQCSRYPHGQHRQRRAGIAGKPPGSPPAVLPVQGLVAGEERPGEQQGLEGFRPALACMPEQGGRRQRNRRGHGRPAEPAGSRRCEARQRHADHRHGGEQARRRKAGARLPQQCGGPVGHRRLCDHCTAVHARQDAGGGFHQLPRPLRQPDLAVPQQVASPERGQAAEEAHQDYERKRRRRATENEGHAGRSVLLSVRRMGHQPARYGAA
jgi:hypothetical protein